MKRVGVVGTMVWDTIHGRGTAPEPVEEWGGICYALAALEASLPENWEIVPLIKVGSDLAPKANEFLHDLTKRWAADRFVEVPEPNNRVTIRYMDDQRRTELLSGRVPPWTWDELGPMVGDLDALYVNFISGFEMELEAAAHLRRGFAGPIYADMHSLFLGVRCDGVRFAETLPNVSTWFSCFDVVQLNEDEMNLVGSDPMKVAAMALDAGVKLLIVTLGSQGAVYFATPSFTFFDDAKSPPGHPIRTARIPATVETDCLDPTGCGDVFGATAASALIEGASVEDAIRRANHSAARNLGYRGATHLQYHLRGEIVPK